ncbi:pentatricopeptide repeat-containing protein-like protein [Salvia divinorum]|uniref:Pentatricopeptide repeat-containing protein-like protein n=1 Tax=Salvia divinorum TaxID=28513 RepID=A0ABD1FWL9_SALDI
MCSIYSKSMLAVSKSLPNELITYFPINHKPYLPTPSKGCRNLLRQRPTATEPPTLLILLRVSWWKANFSTKLKDAFHSTGERTKPVDVLKDTYSQFYFPHKNIIGFSEIKDNFMVEGLQTTLKYFASQGHLTKAFRIFRIIQRHALASASCDSVEDSLSYLLFSCTEHKLLIEGKQLHAQNALISMYGKCGDLETARSIFNGMLVKDEISWNSMISEYASKDMWNEAFILFESMQEAGIQSNVITWNTIAGGCLRTGNFKGALELVGRMRVSLCHLDPVALIIALGILPLCARVANLKHGKELHCYIAKREEFWGCLLLWNSLIDTYARSGQVSVARRLFDLLDERDAVTYTSMISGYGVQGDGKVALNLFEEMIRSQIKPDAVAMVSVLSACSHSGLVNHGQSLFEKMQIVYGISPKLEHFSCMVDLYGRAGLLMKAKEILLRMPCNPTPELWATLIGACLIHGNKDIGEWAAGKLLQLKPQHSGHYVLIANMYAAAGCWSKLVEVRSFMRDLGVRKDPGCAWVDIGAGVSPFLVEDTSNSQSAEIFLLLRGLTKQMKDVDSSACTDSSADKETIHGNDWYRFD